MSLTLDDIIDEIDGMTNRDVWVQDINGRVIGKVQAATLVDGEIILSVGAPTIRIQKEKSCQQS